MSVCAGRGGRASLFALGRKGFGAESILCRAQSSVPGGEEFSDAGSAARAVLFHGALFLARRFCACRAAAKRPSFSAHGNPAERSCLCTCCGPIWNCCGAFPVFVEAAPRDRKRRLTRRQFRRLMRALHDFPAPGGCAVKPGNSTDNLLILIPAFNEAGRHRRCRRGSSPGDAERVPVLVVDDASKDGTYARAPAAGAEVLRVPITSVWADACKPDTSWLTNSATNM